MPKFSKATKYNSYLKLGLAGPPGSGKSYTALTIATNLSEKRVAVIDAEMGAASKYANLFDFDVCELTLDDEGRDVAKPYSPQRYMEAIKAAYDSGDYDVLIIDGISPEWDDVGGCLQWVDQITRNNDTRSAWKTVTPVHRQFINYILRVRMHVICTMLAKKEMVVTKDATGRTTGKKVTLEPIQREDVPRIFDVMALMENRDMIIDKTRCPALDDQVIHKPGKEVANILREWLKGDPMPERPEYDPEVTSNGVQPPRQSTAGPANNTSPKPTTAEQVEATATEQQVASIRKLCQHLGKDAPNNVTSLSYTAAKKLISELTTEYQESRKPEPASSALIAQAKALFEQVGRPWEPELDGKSVKVVRTRMEQVSGLHREQINTRNGHPASIEDAPDALSLRKRCSQLQLNWNDLLTQYLGTTKALDKLTSDDRAKVKRGLDIVEENRLKEAVDQVKAS